MLDAETKIKLLRAQRDELTEYAIYQKLARLVKNKERAEILEKISQEELKHYQFFKNITQETVQPNRWNIFFYVFISKTLGLNFGLKLMEAGEDAAQEVYSKLEQWAPEIKEIIREEKTHELALIDLINEERLKYVGSVVLGLNDALVELTATLAGFTLALQTTRLIGILGLITGIAAAMSMAASEFLSTKHEETDKSPLKASVYTGIAYIITVVVLVLPYFLFHNIFLCLGTAIAIALFIIFLFTFYMAVAKNLPFGKRFAEMAWLSLSIAAITFFIGLAIRKVFGIAI